MDVFMSKLTEKHILFISYDGLTDPLGQSQIIPYLKGIAQHGYRFTILSCDKPDAYQSNQVYVERLLQNFAIRWISIPYHKTPPVLSSVYDYIALKKKAAKLFQEDPYVMVHTRPGIPTLLALWLKKKFGIYFFNDVRGFWADERVDGGMWNLKNPLYKKIYQFFKQHEYDCLNQADAVTCLTEAAKKEMQSWTAVSKQPLPITVIPCSVDLQLFNPDTISAQTKSKWKSSLGIKDDEQVFSYLGSIGGWYLTDEMMQFAVELSKEIPKAKFLFISPHRHEKIREAAKQNGLDVSKLVISSAARHEVPELLSLSDYSLFFIKPCYSKISSSPTKHGEIMAMGIPVITNSGVGDVAEIVERYESGFLLPQFSKQDFQHLAKQIATAPVFNPEAIRNAAKEIYSLDHAISKYTEKYQQVLG
jgi:glycosyltransferase involved in cell wall biosynthesis